MNVILDVPLVWTWSKVLEGGEVELTCMEDFKIWLLSKGDKGDFLVAMWWLFKNSLLLVWLSRESRRFFGGAAGLGVRGGSGGCDRAAGGWVWGWARPWTLRLVAVAKRSSNSLLGTCTLPQYINCNNLSKCTGETSFRKTTGWRSGLRGLGGWRVSISLNKGLQAHSTSLKWWKQISNLYSNSRSNLLWVFTN